MRKYCLLFITFIIIVLGATTKINVAYANDSVVYLGGMPAGFSLNTKGAYVLGLTDVITQNGVCSPAKEAGIEKGDVILKIDGTSVNNAIDVEKTLISDKIKNVLIERKDKTENVLIKPSKDVNGKFKIGVFLRDNIKGIGTITFIKNGRFASLGHPISDENSKIAKITGGELYDCYITGNIKGERGKPGELKGIFTKTLPIGEVENNLEEGVYGKANKNFNLSELKQIEIGMPVVGNATIFSTIKGNKPKEYKISIIKVENDLEKNKNVVVKITDKELISETGGIVQGMSGSPIVQNGKLVGAITHVFINDPTRGFAISINNMINK